MLERWLSPLFRPRLLRLNLGPTAIIDVGLRYIILMFMIVMTIFTKVETDSNYKHHLVGTLTQCHMLTTLRSLHSKTEGSVAAEGRNCKSQDLQESRSAAALGTSST